MRRATHKEFSQQAVLSSEIFGVIREGHAEADRFDQVIGEYSDPSMGSGWKTLYFRLCLYKVGAVRSSSGIARKIYRKDILGHPRVMTYGTGTISTLYTTYRHERRIRSFPSNAPTRLKSLVTSDPCENSVTPSTPTWASTNKTNSLR